MQKRNRRQRISFLSLFFMSIFRSSEVTEPFLAFWGSVLFQRGVLHLWVRDLRVGKDKGERGVVCLCVCDADC